MQRLRPDIGTGTSPQPTLTVATSERGCVQVLALLASSCTANEPLVYNTTNFCVINFQNRYA